MTSSQIDVPAASFPPLSRSGVLMGLSGGQLALLAVPVLVMIGREHLPQGSADDDLLLEAETLEQAAMRIEPADPTEEEE